MTQINLLFIGDGRRDAVTVPRITEKILGVDISEETKNWARLHGKGGRGYDRKLRYGVRVLKSLGYSGLVATVDRDASTGDRLQRLQSVREKEKIEDPSLVIALGEAVPHGEAWLLSDPVAVKKALLLDTGASIPAPGKVRNPKKTLTRLLSESPRAGERPVEIFPDIASRMSMDRCRDTKRIGLQAFIREVETELSSL